MVPFGPPRGRNYPAWKIAAKNISGAADLVNPRQPPRQPRVPKSVPCQGRAGILCLGTPAGEHLGNRQARFQRFFSWKDRLKKHCENRAGVACCHPDLGMIGGGNHAR
jgi:hypothetical protein